MEDEIKTAKADSWLEINVDCPYCYEYLDVLEQAREYLDNGELSAQNIECEITCPECKKDFIVTDINF